MAWWSRAPESMARPKSTGARFGPTHVSPPAAGLDGVCVRGGVSAFLPSFSARRRRVRRPASRIGRDHVGGRRRPRHAFRSTAELTAGVEPGLHGQHDTLIAILFDLPISSTAMTGMFKRDRIERVAHDALHRRLHLNQQCWPLLHNRKWMVLSRPHTLHVGCCMALPFINTTLHSNTHPGCHVLGHTNLGMLVLGSCSSNVDTAGASEAAHHLTVRALPQSHVLHRDIQPSQPPKGLAHIVITLECLKI